jgi:hypothetical protein
VISDPLLARILSLEHVVELAYQVIRELYDRVEMPELEQGLVLVDANLQNRESFLVCFYILERCDHVFERLGSY